MKNYLYIVNYPVYEENLCKMELECLFNEGFSGKYLFSDIYISPSRSPFLKEVIKIKYVTENFNEIIKYICDEKLSYDDFKAIYIKLDNDELTYSERLNSVREIGLNIIGEADIHNPKVVLAITKLNGVWIFGEYERNDYKWHIHEKKPNNYSNSLGVRLARALVNIAVENDLNKSLVDPCCGVGTIIIEAASMNINVKGFEIRKSIASNARRNLEFFGYDKNLVTAMDMHNIKDRYDVAIIDLPYGLFTPITLEEQISLIKSARRISEKLILVVFEEMKEEIEATGFKIKKTCTVNKGNFKRIIHICE